jgi:hemerythrin superfamily protein
MFSSFFLAAPEDTAMDAIKFLTRQHREVEALFAEYERAPVEGRALFGRIERALIPHAIIEEQYLYPAIRERVPNGERLAEHAIHEHAQVEESLNRIGGMINGDNPFAVTSEMSKVIRSVRDHVREEEESPGLFSMLRATMSQRELAELGRTLQRAWEMAPTRAHPLAPDRPPANKLLGLPVAMVDRLRDNLSGRAAESAESEKRVRRAPARKRRARTTTRKASKSTRGMRGRKASSRKAARATRRPARRSNAKRVQRARGRTTKARRR